jgi:hypothetical protein
MPLASIRPLSAHLPNRMGWDLASSPVQMEAIADGNNNQALFYYTAQRKPERLDVGENQRIEWGRYEQPPDDWVHPMGLRRGPIDAPPRASCFSLAIPAETG